MTDPKFTPPRQEGTPPPRRPNAPRDPRPPREWRVRERITPVMLAFLVYILLLVTRLIDASILTRDNEYFAVVVLQLSIFLIPGFAYLLWRGDGLRPRLRMTLPRPGHVLFLFGAILLLAGGGVLLQLLFGSVKVSGGNFVLYDTFVSKHDGTAGNVAYLVVTYAALPAFCEELIFRGIFCAEYEGRGAVCASMMSTFFFALLHFDLRHLPVYLFAGVVLSAVMYATRSLIAAMVVHFGYNLFCLFGVPYITAFYTSVGDIWVLFFLLVVVMLFGALLFCGEAARFYRHFASRGMVDGANVTRDFRQNLISFVRLVLTPGVGVCCLLYLVVVVWGIFN